MIDREGFRFFVAKDLHKICVPWGCQVQMGLVKIDDLTNNLLLPKNSR